MICEKVSAFDLLLPLPPSGVDLAGFVPPRAWNGDTSRDLFASFLLFYADVNVCIVLCAVDTLFLDNQFQKDLQARIGDDFKLLLVASHTHNAPNLAKSVQSLGRVDPDWYEEVLACISEAVLGHEVKKPAEQIRHTVQMTDFCVNRRLSAVSLNYSALRQGKISIERGISMAPNPHGIVDNRLHLVEFADAEGNTLACLWSLAAHPAFEPKRSSLSSDYPGAVRSYLKAVHGSNCVVLYLPGLAGSAIPAFIPKASNDMTLRELLFSILPLHHSIPPADPTGYETFARDLATHLIAPKSQPDWVSSTGLKLEFEISLPELIFYCYRNDPLHLSVSALRLGNVLDLVVLNGEPLTEWCKILESKKGYPSARIISGYGAGDCLYIPPEEELCKGGYEVSRFRASFGLFGEFSEGLNQKFLAAIAQVTKH